MSKIIKIKGANSNLEVAFAEGASLPQILEEFTNIFTSSAQFFAPHTLFTLPDNYFSTKEKQIIADLFAQFQMELQFSTRNTKLDDKQDRTIMTDKFDKLPDNIVKHHDVELQANTNISELVQLPLKEITQQVRNGEEILYPGSLIIHGNVNPGATVKAYGFIDIHGRCLGLVHAGANGNEAAYVIADQLAPIQIRIASHVACSPDNQEIHSSQCEIARIYNRAIVIEEYQRP